MRSRPTSPALDSEPGALVRALQLRVRQARRVPDLRVDVLLDVGLLLGPSDRVVIEPEAIKLTRTTVRDAVEYAVTQAGVVVFEALYQDGDLVFGTFTKAEWCVTLARVVAERRLALGLPASAG